MKFPTLFYIFNSAETCCYVNLLIFTYCFYSILVSNHFFSTVAVLPATIESYRYHCRHRLASGEKM